MAIPTDSAPTRRCERHNLAAAPDGQCVLCRREAGPGIVQPDVSVEPGHGVLGWLLRGVTATALVGGVAWAASTWSATPAPNAVTGTAIHDGRLGVSRATEPGPEVKPPAAAEPPNEERIKTPEEQVAEAELAREQRERAQADAERAQADAERAQRERQKALGAQLREREEAARDRQRHAEVQRDLDAQSVRAARRSVSIVMYSTSWCGSCVRARAYMQQQNIPFSEHDVDRDPAARAQARALNARGSVPTISIDGDVMVGFSPGGLESRIERAARKRAGS